MTAQKKTPTPTTTLVKLKKNHRVLRLSIQWTKKKSNRRYGVSADELTPAWNVTVPRLRRNSSGPDSVVHCRPLTVFCVLKLKQ